MHHQLYGWLETIGGLLKVALVVGVSIFLYYLAIKCKLLPLHMTEVLLLTIWLIAKKDWITDGIKYNEQSIKSPFAAVW